MYANQTGNDMDAAERIAREAERRDCPVSLLSLDRFDPICIPKEQVVIFLVSTTGQGDTPDSMKAFWRFLLQKILSPQWLEGVNYAVFGLGDSGYQKYNELPEDVKAALQSRCDIPACLAIGKFLADRARVADVYTASYTPRDRDKFEDIVMVVGAIVVGYISCLFQQALNPSLPPRVIKPSGTGFQEHPKMEKPTPVVESVKEEPVAGWPSFCQLIGYAGC